MRVGGLVALDLCASFPLQPQRKLLLMKPPPLDCELLLDVVYFSSFLLEGSYTRRVTHYGLVYWFISPCGYSSCHSNSYALLDRQCQAGTPRSTRTGCLRLSSIGNKGPDVMVV